jgi:hypothetical protein
VNCLFCGITKREEGAYWGFTWEFWGSKPLSRAGFCRFRDASLAMGSHWGRLGEFADGGLGGRCNGLGTGGFALMQIERYTKAEGGSALECYEGILWRVSCAGGIGARQEGFPTGVWVSDVTGLGWA